MEHRYEVKFYGLNRNGLDLDLLGVGYVDAVDQHTAVSTAARFNPVWGWQSVKITATREAAVKIKVNVEAV